MALRIVLVGQAAFAEQVLRGLMARGDTISAVYCPPDGGRPDPLKQLAVVSGVTCRQPASYKGAGVQGEIADLKPDLLMLAYVTKIVPLSVVTLPRLGSICFHPSLLPRYRGGSAINWQLIRGETVTGVSVFWPDAGIDTGPLLLQREIPIGPDDTAGSLYYGRIMPAGIEAMLEAVALIDAGTAPRIVQDESRASYDPLCRDAHALVDWTQPGNAVHNLIRGCDPQPGAHTPAGKGRLRLYESRRVMRGDEAGVEAGTIVAVEDRALVIATPEGAVRIGRARIDGSSDKRAAAESAAALGVGVGDRLG